MDTSKQNSCLEILELPPDSSWTEITKSYNNLKQLYSQPSLALAPVEEELSDNRRAEILQEIEYAYAELEKLSSDSKKNLEKNIKFIISEIDFFSGRALKVIRERLNIELCDIAMETKIQHNHLKKIEDEEYEALPREIYIIGYLKNYARYLSLDPNQVVADYMQGYYQWRAQQPDE
jgi:hypothetical protein